jgi:hypothetical protein
VAAVAAVSIAALLASASAAAAQRYASPGGAGTTCSQPTPCSVQVALSGAGPGDEIILAPGDYGSPTPITTTLGLAQNNLWMHGVAGQPAPIIHFGSGGYLRDGSPGDRVSYVQLIGTSPAALQVDEATASADQVTSHTGSADGCIVFGTLTDSVCSTSATVANALDANIGATSYTLTLRNDTLEATAAGSVGLGLHTTGGTLTTNAANLIVHGAANDIAVGATGGTQTLNIDHSNYATATGTVINSTNQQTAAPLLANPAAGDFQELAGSPTIDAGINTPANGAFDYLGRPREINGATDIGAYEFDSFSGVSLGNQKSKVKKGKAKVAIGCPAGFPSPCAGTLSLTYKKGKKIATAGSAQFSVDAGATAVLKVKLSKSTIRRLRKRGKLALNATVTATDGLGTPGAGSGTVKLKG